MIFGSILTSKNAKDEDDEEDDDEEDDDDYANDV